jgi:hypothetical protein
MASFLANIQRMRMHRDQPRYINRRGTSPHRAALSQPRERYLAAPLATHTSFAVSSNPSPKWWSTSSGYTPFEGMSGLLSMTALLVVQTFQSFRNPGCRLHANGYAGLYTPDVTLWVINSRHHQRRTLQKLWPRGRTVTMADLKKIPRRTRKRGVAHYDRTLSSRYCKDSLAAILISYYIIHPTSIYPCRLQILYPFDFTPSTQFLPSHVQLVQACLFQYKGFRLYTDVTVRNKVEEESNLTGTPPQPLPEGMEHVLRLHTLRRNVCTNGADLSINFPWVPPSCRCDGYPDVLIPFATTNDEPLKITAKTGRTVARANLKKMLVCWCVGVCALSPMSPFPYPRCTRLLQCSRTRSYFEITPAQLANREYRLPPSRSLRSDAQHGLDRRWCMPTFDPSPAGHMKPHRGALVDGSGTD